MEDKEPEEVCRNNHLNFDDEESSGSPFPGRMTMEPVHIVDLNMVTGRSEGVMTCAVVCETQVSRSKLLEVVGRLPILVFRNIDFAMMFRFGVDLM